MRNLCLLIRYLDNVGPLKMVYLIFLSSELPPLLPLLSPSSTHSGVFEDEMKVSIVFCVASLVFLWIMVP